MKNIKITAFILTFIFATSLLFSQDIEYKPKSVRTGIAIGSSEGKREIGQGILYSFGWNIPIGEKQKLRLNPNITFGGMSSRLVLGPREQFYKVSACGLYLHYDLFRYKSVSLVVSAGGFVNYSRGLLGTGGDGEGTSYSSSDYFNTLYLGGYASGALRMNPKNKRFAYELRPISLLYGGDRFYLAYFMFGMDVKFRK